MLKTPLCDLLAVEYPIFSVGFGKGATAELAAAVSNAGGCGVLGGSHGSAGGYLQDQIRKVRTLTNKAFGVNVIIEPTAFPSAAADIEVALAEKVPLLVLFWGDPRPYVEEAHRHGTKVFIQVGSVEEALAANAAGVDAIIAQGFEAGGHVRGKTALSVLVPAVVDAVKPLPVLASGGIGDGRGVAAALALGAGGVSLGTRFVASTEAYARADYKQRVVESRAEDTVYGDVFNNGWKNTTQRMIRNRTVEFWESAGEPSLDLRSDRGDVVGTIHHIDGKDYEIPRYSAIMASPNYDIDLEDASLWAGQSVELVREIKAAGEIVRNLVREAENVISNLQSVVRDPAVVR